MRLQKKEEFDALFGYALVEPPGLWDEGGLCEVMKRSNLLGRDDEYQNADGDRLLAWRYHLHGTALVRRLPARQLGVVPRLQEHSEAYLPQCHDEQIIADEQCVVDYDDASSGRTA